MRIDFERTGGFAGVRLTATIDSDTLSPEEADNVREMVDAANFFNLPPKIAAREQGVDRFQYRVTVESEGRRHSVDIQEAAIPPPVRPLLQWLSAAARKKRHKER
jgi:hypothetical protein